MRYGRKAVPTTSDAPPSNHVLIITGTTTCDGSIHISGPKFLGRATSRKLPYTKSQIPSLYLSLCYDSPITLGCFG